MPDILATLVGGHASPHITYSKLKGNPHAGLNRDVPGAIAQVIIDAPPDANKFYFTSVDVYELRGQPAYIVKLALENYTSVRAVSDRVTAHTDLEPNQKWLFVYQDEGNNDTDDAYIISTLPGDQEDRVWTISIDHHNECYPRSVIKLESKNFIPTSPFPNLAQCFQIKALDA